MELFDAGFFGFSPHDAAIMDPQHRHFLECAGRRSRTPATPRALRRRDRRLRRLRPQRLLPLQPADESRAGAAGGLLPAAPHRQRQGLPRHARLLPARPARAERQRPDGLLDLARRDPRRVPEPAQRRVRHGARRRRHDRAAAPPRLPLPRGRDPLARRPLPRLRREVAGHGLRQRRRRRRAAPPRRRARATATTSSP